MKKWLTLFLTGCAGLALLAACGDGDEMEGLGETFVNIYGEAAEGSAVGESAGEESVPEPESPKPPEPDLVGMTLEEYKALAASYQEEGLWKKSRDVLELCWMRYGDEEAFRDLQKIVVNVSEESERVQEEARLLWQDLELEEYRNEAAAVICSPDWLGVMMPRLLEGRRGYYLEDQDAGTVMLWQAGYTGQGQTDTRVWYQNEKDVIFLRRTGSVLLMLQTECSPEGAYQGAFDAWSCDGTTGTVLHQVGTLQNGLLNGACAVWVHSGDGDSDLFTLWTSRENLDFDKYQGDFNSDGTTAVKQLTKKEKKNLEGARKDMDQLIYAYTENGKNFLFRNVPQGSAAEETPFEAKALGLLDVPEWTSYEPVRQETPDDGEERMVRVLDVKIRVFGGNLEWFDGTQWHTVGSVAEYVDQDPLGGYAGRQAEGVEEDDSEDQSGLLSEDLGTGQVKQSTPSQPSAKPSGEPTPAPSEPAPAPSEPTPAPSTPAPAPSTPAPAPSEPAPAPSAPSQTPSEAPQTPSEAPQNPSGGETTPPSTGDGNDMDYGDWIL